MIEPGASFNDNLQKWPPIEAVQRIDLIAEGAVVASIQNRAG